MSAEARKKRIAARFGSAASTYDQSAELQRRVAHGLVRRIGEHPLPPAPRVLEIGCGTGFLTRCVLPGLENGRFVVSDIAPALLDQARAMLPGNIPCLAMDGELPAFRDRSFDLVMSSLAAQWFHDPPATLERLMALLAPGGLLAVATLGPGSLFEWKEAQRPEGARHGTPDYRDAASYPGFTCDGERMRMEYADALDFLRSLRRIGATEPRPGHNPLSAGALRRAAGRLGLRPSITYDILYLFRRAA